VDAAASVDYTSPPSRRADSPRTREAGVEGTEDTKGAELAAAAAFSAIGASYWYLLALGTFAVSAVLPVPDRLPLVPGWPTMEADTAPVCEDSANFFYLPVRARPHAHVPSYPAAPKLVTFGF
jgi:hypothetical protein